MHLLPAHAHLSLISEDTEVDTELDADLDVTVPRQRLERMRSGPCWFVQ